LALVSNAGVKYSIQRLYRQSIPSIGVRPGNVARASLGGRGFQNVLGTGSIIADRRGVLCQGYEGFIWFDFIVLGGFSRGWGVDRFEGIHRSAQILLDRICETVYLTNQLYNHEVL
jgi:hypothetical protein